MTNDLALRDTDSWTQMLPSVAKLADSIAQTSFVPKALRGKPAEVAACVLAGREIGVGPMEALQKINIIDGRPSLAAELMRSLVLRAGHQIRFSNMSDESVTIEGRRAGDEQWTSLTWTLDDAKRIGVAGKTTWKQYPRQMLSARATSELCRLMFPDALGGLSYTPEEVQDMPADPTPAATPDKAETVVVSRSGRKKPDRQDTAAVMTEDGPVAFDPDSGAMRDPGEIIDAEIVEPGGPDTSGPITDLQVKHMFALLRGAGAHDKADMIATIAEITGREVASSSELTQNEYELITGTLESLAATE